MTSSRNLSAYGQYALPTDTTKTYTFTPGTGWVVAASGGGSTPLLLHAQDQKASGTYGGTASSTAWSPRTLNTTVTNDIIGASVASNVITLPSGSYSIDCSVPFGIVPATTRLYNVTDSATVKLGTSCGYDGANVVTTRSFITGTFTISAQKTFRIEYNMTPQQVNDLGSIANRPGILEVYTDLRIWKLS